MARFYTEQELKDMGMDAGQIRAILSVQDARQVEEDNPNEVPEGELLPGSEESEKLVQMHQVYNIPAKYKSSEQLIPTSITQIASYKRGTVVELPPFGDGQPFVARMVRPSMLALIKGGKIPNTLLNQATSLFANGTSALNAGGKNATNVSELFEVIDVIVNAALLEPTIEEIRSVGMELTDEQLMAIFSYTQRGIKALEQFRTE